MHNTLLTPRQVEELIAQNKTLILAADEKLLDRLPRGNWIGGTIPYFMSEEGGLMTKEGIFVNDITDLAEDFYIHTYNKDSIGNIIKDRYDNGFSYLLIPGFSDVLQEFAMIAQNLDGLYDNPLTGWVTGFDLNEDQAASPQIINGQTLEKSDNLAICMHVKLPESKIANIEIINIFEQGDGDVLTFKNDGFDCKECYINGKEENFAEYIEKNQIDTRLPIVADYSGAMINISFQKVDTKEKKVVFYAPVRKGVEYRLAKPVDNYVDAFNSQITNFPGTVVSSFNCILNYLYSELEGKKTGNLKGPFTFGEIAYLLVNQTMVYLNVADS